MKDKAEIMSPPSGRPKRRSVWQKQNDSKSITEEKKDIGRVCVKKKKIKIRLKDLANPESFVCEIFDSSLDDSDSKVEDSDVLDSSLEVKEATNGLESEKPKNYFDILMSKESRRSFNVISAVENETIPEESKLKRIEESEEVVNERKTAKKRNEARLSEMLAAKKLLKKEIIESDTSDDETLFSVRSKLKNRNQELEKKNGLVNSMQSKLSTILKNNTDLNENGSEPENTKEISNPEPRKKAPNILNYFTKVESNSNETKLKTKSKVKNKKLKEIDMFKSMKKPSWEIQLKNQEDEKESETKEVAVDSDEEFVDISNKKNNKNRLTKNKLSENVKLAPLFQKKVKKEIDPEIQKARLEFLHSGLPSAVKKTGENQKSQIELDVVYFPEISHVQQKDESSFWTLQNITLPLKEIRDYVFDNSRQFRFKIGEEKLINGGDENLKVEAEDDALKRMRYRYKNVEVDRIFYGLKEKREKFVQKIREIENIHNPIADDSIEVIDNDNSNLEIFNTLWTDKYKPKSSEILGNTGTVRKLGKWLEAWKSFDEEMKRLTKLGVKVKSKAAADNSSDDFVTSDEDDYGIRSPANTCLLSGPNGCGKTALVYALANELDFNVLEVNASSKRTGKKLLTDLQEATQSHKVHHAIGSQPLANLFEKSGNNKSKKKLKVKKRKKKKEAVQPDQVNNSCKISLILIEDADIVFEEYDDGFVPAIVTLVQSSKRPVIFLTSDPSCNHLDKIRTPSCVVLEMERPGFVSSCALLDMISVLEGIHVKEEAIESIIEQNHNDLRKSLLELQFWLQLGQPVTSVPMPSTLGRIWWGCNKFLYNDEIKHRAKPKPSKRKRVNELFDSSDEEVGPVKKLKTNDEDSTVATRPPTVEKETITRDPTIHHFSKILDVMCMVDVLHLPTDEEPIPEWEYRPTDSLSLAENMGNVKSAEADLSKGLVNELINLSSRIFIKNKDVNDRKLSFDNPSWEEICWRKQQEEAKMELTYLVPFCSGKEKRNLNLDYLPIIRNICRTEKHRFSSNTKRKNRFYHYLRTLGADPNDENIEISCEVLKFQS